MFELIAYEQLLELLENQDKRGHGKRVLEYFQLHKETLLRSLEKSIDPWQPIGDGFKENQTVLTKGIEIGRDDEDGPAYGITYFSEDLKIDYWTSCKDKDKYIPTHYALRLA